MGLAGSIRAYNQNGIPVFVLVDPEGIIKDIQFALVSEVGDRIQIPPHPL